MSARVGPRDAARRLVLRGLAVGGVLMLGACAGAARRGATAEHAVAWPAPAFNAIRLNDAVRGLYGDLRAHPNRNIRLDIPVIAEAGQSVPLTVYAPLSNVSAITILAADNANPLNGHYLLSPNTLPRLTTRIKLEKSTTVLVLVRTGGILHMASAEVKIVSPDGCPV